MELVTALASMKAGIELAVVALEARDDGKAKQAVSEMSKQLANANLGALAMSEKLLTLREELDKALNEKRDLEKRLNERQRYVLRDVGRGLLAYAYEPTPGDGTPAHYRCQICHDRGEASILTPTGNGIFLTCRVDNKHSLQIAPLPPIARKATRHRL